MSHYDIDRLRESMVKILGSDGQPVAGSGFIIRSDGYLVTCHHVIYLLDSLNVEYQGQIYAAEWCEELSNPEVDIAILKIGIEGAKAVPIINPQHLSTSVTVYGFPPSQKKYFPEGIAVSAQSIRRSAPLNTVSTYRTREIKATNPWNKLPQENATFLSHRIDAKVDSGTSGGAVSAEELGGVVGVIQCSKSDESYVIRWDNITEYLNKLGLEPQKNAVCRFLEEIENNFEYDKLLHIPEQPIILKDQYIPIQVTLQRKYTHAVETTWGYAESDAELKRAYALKRLEESQPSQVDWKEAKKQHQRIMVLADPGMGKSTLLRREACLTAQEERQSLKNNNKKLEEVVFPLFLRLSDLAETPEEIIDAIPLLIQRDYSEMATQVMELLREKLKVGKCLLLLDALDEVPTEHRKRLVEKLNRFAQRKPLCPIICTSRIVGYSGAFLADVKEVEIVPFSQKQTEQYIETWFRNAAGYLNNDTVSASSLIRELRNKPQIRGLAQNPLLLSLICSLYQEKGLTLPARRCQVYEQAVRHMLGKWRKKRNPELNDAWIDAKTELLEEIAYQFSCDGKEIFTLRELRKTIDEYLRSGNASTDFDNLNAHLLISELSEQDGILQKLHKDSDQQYLFLHRTFQEYLTACYLNRARDSIALAKAHFWEYEWHETLSLLAGFMENPVPLLQAITAEKDDIFSTLLLLAGRCIAECEENPHPLIAEIIDKIYKFWQSYLSADFINSTVVALGKVNSQMFQSLQADLNASNSYVRMKAGMVLDKISNAPEVEELIVFLNDSDSDVRRYAVITLAEIGNAQAVETLIAALNDSDSYVRIEAAEALAKIGNAQGVEVLIAALNNSDSYVRIQAAEALAEIGNTQGVEALIAALNDSDSYVKIQAAEVLAKIGNTQGVKVLIAALNDSDSYVRVQAAEALAEIGNAQGVEALIVALNNSDSEVRAYAAEALAEIGNAQAVEALIAALNDSNSYVRIQAAEALGKIGNAQAVQALIAVLNDSDSYVRAYTAEALAKMGDAQAVEALIAALNNSDGELREHAAEALAENGNAPTLKKLIESLEIDIRRPDIFSLTRTLAVRFSKEKLPFIPVYPELVAHKQSGQLQASQKGKRSP
jgi:HEAT repeat protein/phage terminase Nu1 subunit (DNA packaging protein)